MSTGNKIESHKALHDDDVKISGLAESNQHRPCHANKKNAQRREPIRAVPVARGPKLRVLYIKFFFFNLSTKSNYMYSTY